MANLHLLVLTLLFSMAVQDPIGPSRFRREKYNTRRRRQVPSQKPLTDTEIACGYWSEEDTQEIKEFTNSCARETGVSINNTALDITIQKEITSKTNPEYYKHLDYNNTREYAKFFADIGVAKEVQDSLSSCLFDKMMKLLEEAVSYYADLGDITFQRNKKDYLASSKDCKGKVDPDACLYYACVNGIIIKSESIEQEVKEKR